jgi:hypothetical protein
VIFLLILKNYETWTRSVEITPERSTVRKQEAKIENPSTARPQKVAGMTQPDAASIAVKNIFSPDRKDFPAQSSDTRKVVRPQIILYGTTIGDDYQFASIVNPGRSLLRGERETMSLKVGDKVGDYKLAKVLPDRIVMEGGEDSFEVLLYDAKAPKKRTEVRTESKPAAVTSTLPTVPAPGAPKTTPPAVAEKAPPVPPAVTTPPIVPTRPRPVSPTTRRRMILGPREETPATPSAPAPQQEREEN